MQENQMEQKVVWEGYLSCLLLGNTEGCSMEKCIQRISLASNRALKDDY